MRRRCLLVVFACALMVLFAVLTMEAEEGTSDSVHNVEEVENRVFKTIFDESFLDQPAEDDCRLMIETSRSGLHERLLADLCSAAFVNWLYNEEMAISDYNEDPRLIYLKLRLLSVPKDVSRVQEADRKSLYFGEDPTVDFLDLWEATEDSMLRAAEIQNWEPLWDPTSTPTLTHTPTLTPTMTQTPTPTRTSIPMPGHKVEVLRYRMPAGPKSRVFVSRERTELSIKQVTDLIGGIEASDVLVRALKTSHLVVCSDNRKIPAAMRSENEWNRIERNQEASLCFAAEPSGSDEPGTHPDFFVFGNEVPAGAYVLGAGDGWSLSLTERLEPIENLIVVVLTAEEAGE